MAASYSQEEILDEILTKEEKIIMAFISKNPDKILKSGFWKYHFETDTYIDFLPTPIENSSSLTKEEKQIFLQELEKIEEISYKKYYLGTSQCRICLKENGSMEYYHLKNEKLYVFPSGYKHYILDHNVIIDPWFYNMVIGKDKSIYEKTFEEKYDIQDID